ncbi:hypothetical protein GCM10020331_029010 [Ectobacillus funiculus]
MMTKRKTNWRKKAMELLQQRGVTIEHIAELVYFLQKKTTIQILLWRNAAITWNAYYQKREVQKCACHRNTA